MLKNPTPHLSLCEREDGAFFGQFFHAIFPCFGQKEILSKFFYSIAPMLQ
jgi:hypothetical protein